MSAPAPLPVRTERLRPRLGALFILALGIAVVGSSLPILSESDVIGESLFDPFLQLGPRSWIVERDGRCVGAFNSGIQPVPEGEIKEGGYRIGLHGRFVGGPDERSAVYDFFAEASFSSYRLLNKVDIHLEDASSSLELAGTSRSLLASRVRLGDSVRERKSPFPNGILLLDGDESGFRLSLPRYLARVLALPPAKTVRISESSKSDMEECKAALSASAGAAFDVVPYFQRLQEAS